MAGLIKREDIDEVRTRTDLKEIVDAYVTLKSAGIGSYKGLCPFHDERSPSFHVRPQMGYFHCFGCQESGDVISFIQKMDHISFSEAVEKLAGRIGYELRYEDGGTGPRREDVGKRQRLLDAHKIAGEFFRAQLLTPQAAAGRAFLSERGFDREAAEHFGVGFAPQGWDALLKHLTGKGFTHEELKLTGMFSEGQRGIYDRFRGRLIWPIRDIAGDTVGFGARKLFEDDQGPKYLNTPETSLYKKSQVLYGIDLAKKAIASKRQLVVVEGYTDVMACHLAGIDTAVATCGTAFGAEHIKVARRLLSDDGTGGEVVFTFDGDAAGQKAALKAFDEDQRFVAQTFVAVEPSGADPCELRQRKGDEAVHALIRSRRPLFEFAIRTTLAKFDLSTVEGRVSGLRASAPVVASIRDGSTRMGYSQELAGWLGLADPNEVLRAVKGAERRSHTQPGSHTSGAHTQSGSQAQPGAHSQPGAALTGQGNQRDGVVHGRQLPGAAAEVIEAPPAFVRPDPRDPQGRMEREALEVVLQHPGYLSAGNWQHFAATEFVVPAYRAIQQGIYQAGESQEATSQWLEGVRAHVPPELGSLVAELALSPLPATREETLQRYCRDILRRLFELQITRLKEERLGALQRMDPAVDPESYNLLQRELMELETARRQLRGDG
ncbi:DNA primase [Arthrobacter psychrochitiniphilus]|uniref:DNA primase n=1 Tax=Arthrobacter psychrochitiniphilus TaxID=291045 RepID=A0A2V3DX83_9MICC|nr:DNA primase [Arthrobacter psychrochitiniphilus]NYG16764.1 DNA primase [Arthrobacter psychrochitiniphilus]PXA69140.1 DNA primase [Arthrobacter psychrochitiniphilus]